MCDRLVPLAFKKIRAARLSCDLCLHFSVNLREYRAAECAGVRVCVCTLSVCCVCVFCSACGVCQYVRGPGCMGVVFGVCLCQVRACVRVWSGVLLVLVLY